MKVTCVEALNDKRQKWSKEKKEMARKKKEDEKIKRAIEKNEITIQIALKMWNEKYPDVVVTDQTMRNWCRRFAIGKKQNCFLLRSKFIVYVDRLNEFMDDPMKFLAE